MIPEETDKIGESQIVEQAPDGRVVNCKVSQWSIWSDCNVHGAKCGRGVKTRVRQILVGEICADLISLYYSLQ